MGFFDETGITDRPFVVKTWAPRGKTPIIPSAGGWKSQTVLGTIVCTPHGKHPRFFGKIIRHSCHSEDIIDYLKQLKKAIRGRKLLLFWDGLSAHRSKETLAFIQTQKDWLTIERLPSYAPEMNPIETGWSYFKRTSFSNRLSASLEEMTKIAKKGLRRLQRSTNVLTGCLKNSGLFG